MLKADLVVFQDVEKWSRKGRTHRAQIRGEQGLQWINLPIRTEDRSLPINEVRLDHNQNWFDSFWNSIHHNYSNAIYFDFLENEILSETKMAHEFENLIDFNLYFLSKLSEMMDFELKYQLASQTESYSTFPDQCAHDLGFDNVYLEHDSKNYQRKSSLAIPALLNHPEYRQAYTCFVEGCSIIDLFLNHGPESFKILDLLKPSTH